MKTTPVKATQDDVKRKLEGLAKDIKGERVDAFKKRDEFTYQLETPHITADKFDNLNPEEKKGYAVSSYGKLDSTGKKIEISPSDYSKLSSREKNTYQVSQYYEKNFENTRVSQSEYNALSEDEKKGYKMMSPSKSEKWINKEIEGKPELKEFFQGELLSKVRELFYQENDHSDADKMSILNGAIANFNETNKQKGGKGLGVNLTPSHLLYQAFKTAAAEENKDVTISKDHLEGKGPKQEEAKVDPSTAAKNPFAQQLLEMLGLGKNSGQSRL